MDWDPSVWVVGLLAIGLLLLMLLRARRRGHVVVRAGTHPHVPASSSTSTTFYKPVPGIVAGWGVFSTNKGLRKYRVVAEGIPLSDDSKAV
jgi:hypothetical protein